MRETLLSNKYKILFELYKNLCLNYMLNPCPSATQNLSLNYT